MKACKHPAECFISADIATTKGLRQSFLGIAVHYWCGDCSTFKVAGLDLVEMEGRHSAHNIAKLLDGSLKKAGLNNSPLRFVTDGASNMKAVIWHPFLTKNLFNSVEELDDDKEVECVDSEFNYEEPPDEDQDEEDFFDSLPHHTVCSAHTLQLVLRDVFETSEKMIALRKRIFAVIGKFSKSEYATKALVKKTGKKLLYPANTRWSSLEITYSRLLELVDDVNMICFAQNWPIIKQLNAVCVEELMDPGQSPEMLPINNSIRHIQPRNPRLASIIDDNDDFVIKSVLGNSSSSLCPRFLVFENMQAKWRKKRMRRKLFYWNLKRKRRQSKK
uniref:Transposase n=1 Tax=Ditylenchus dipsaci TaxID=166011 RepID=A0A915D116_9BILA